MYGDYNERFVMVAKLGTVSAVKTRDGKYFMRLTVNGMENDKPITESVYKKLISLSNEMSDDFIFNRVP